MKKLLIFGGTTEGRLLAEALRGRAQITVCVATEYGHELLPEGQGLAVLTGRLAQEQMEPLCAEADLVIDATHPYAALVTENIQKAAAAAQTEYLRLCREKSAEDRLLTAEDASGAAAVLARVQGNILLTTGSKELEAFTAVPDYARRVYPRMLPMEEAISKAVSLGYVRSHIIAMQGPFSQALNEAMIDQFSIQMLVTKDGGKAGGFTDKIMACKAKNIPVLLIGRPPEQAGFTLDEIMQKIEERLAKA